MRYECSLCFRLILPETLSETCPFCGLKPNWRPINKEAIFQFQCCDVPMEKMQRFLFRLERFFDLNLDEPFTHVRAFCQFLKYCDRRDDIHMVRIENASFSADFMVKLAQEYFLIKKVCEINSEDLPLAILS